MSPDALGLVAIKTANNSLDEGTDTLIGYSASTIWVMKQI